MVFVLLALLALPILGLVLFLVKTLLKLSFSVGKILLVLLVIWLIIGIATGGLKQTIDNLGKPYISQDEAGVVHYTGAFSSGELDLRQYTGEQLIKVDVNCALSSVTVIVPEDCVVKLKRQSALSQIQIEEQDEFVAFGEEERVLGSGSTIVELTVRTGLAKVRIQTE